MGFCQRSRQELGLRNGRILGHRRARPTATDVGARRPEPRAGPGNRRSGQHQPGAAGSEEDAPARRAAQQCDAAQPRARQRRGHGDAGKELEACAPGPQPWLH